jgi:hypothetical protein
MQTFTVDQIRKYIQSQDSMGDILFNLSEEAIVEANAAINTESEAYKEGVEEYVSGQKFRNPYNRGYIEYREYEAGWYSMYYQDENNL